MEVIDTTKLRDLQEAIRDGIGDVFNGADDPDNVADFLCRKAATVADRADALEAELAALKAGMRGLVARWYKTGDEAAKVASTVGDDLAEKIVKLVNDARDQCADELAALLPADAEGK